MTATIEPLTVRGSALQATAARPIMPKLIGLCGHMGAGKDAAAALLSMLGYRRIAFADQIRLDVEATIRRGDVPVKALGYAGIAQDIAQAKPEEVWQKPTDSQMRRILQWWGTEYRREEDQDYWVKRALVNITGPTVVSDVRFANEVEALRDRGGVIWKIDRPVILDGIPDHSSETSVNEIRPDLVIANTGTLIDLAAKLTAALWAEQVVERAVIK